jgi:hypothetical protein
MADRQMITQSYTVVASPADSTETVVASVVAPPSLFSGQSFKVAFWANVTAEGSATAVVVKLRRTSLTGTQVGATLTYASTDILAALAFDVQSYALDGRVDTAGQIYVATLTVTTAAGASVVNAAYLECRCD